MNPLSIATAFPVLGLALALTGSAAAQNPIQFTNGQTADAGAVNENFTLVDTKATTAQATADAAQGAATAARTVADRLAAGLTVLTNGNVGVGSGSPQARLDVNGNLICAPTSGNTVRIEGSNDNTSVMHYTGTQPVAGMSIDGWTGQARGSLSFQTRGVSDAGPQTRMMIEEGGGVRMFGPTQDYVMRVGTNGGFQLAHRNSAPDFEMNGANTTLGAGFAGVGVRLTVGVSGDGSRALANSWQVFSDARLKEDVRTIEDPLQIVEQLRGVRFVWKRSGKKDVGFIAQEVETVLPELVESQEGTGFKTLSYDRVVAVLVEAVQEQQKEIAALRSGGAEALAVHNREQASLRAQVDTLGSQVAALQAALQPLLAK